MPGQRVVDGDVGVDGLVLGQLPDGNGVATGKIVDSSQVARADAVGDGADIGIDGDAAVEDRLATGAVIANLADQFDADLDGIATVFAPQVVGFADLVDEADGAGFLQVDGDHLADRPDAGHGAVERVGIGGDPGARAIALDDVSEDALVVLRRVATLLQGLLSLAGFPLNEHGDFPRYPN